jgi:hypothetical protein
MRLEILALHLFKTAKPIVLLQYLLLIGSLQIWLSNLPDIKFLHSIYNQSLLKKKYLCQFRIRRPKYYHKHRNQLKTRYLLSILNRCQQSPTLKVLIMTNNNNWWCNSSIRKCVATISNKLHRSKWCWCSNSTNNNKLTGRDSSRLNKCRWIKDQFLKIKDTGNTLMNLFLRWHYTGPGLRMGTGISKLITKETIICLLYWVSKWLEKFSH